MSHGVLAKLVAKLLDEQSQFSGSVRLLLQELITEAGNVLLDLLQLAYNTVTHGHNNQATYAGGHKTVLKLTGVSICSHTVHTIQ